MRKRVVIVAAVIAGLASTMLSTPTARAADNLVPDPDLAQCIGEAIGGVTGHTPDYATNGITQADFDTLSTAGGLPGPLECWASSDYSKEYNIGNLTGVQYLSFKGVGEDSIGISAGGDNLTDLSPLRGMTQLQYIYITDSKIADISPLAGLTNLDKLLIPGAQVSNISALQGMTKLTFVNLADNKITDASPLSGKTAMTYLVLAGNQITSLPAFTGMTSLNQLALSDNRLTSITQLTALTGLKQLDISSNQISSLAPLPTSVTDLTATDNKISDISPLAKLAGLQALDLGGNQFKDLSPLSGLANLNFIGLRTTGISDLKPLATLANSLKDGYVDVVGNHIADLSPIKPCSRAQNLAGNTASCTSFSAVPQTLTGSATVGVAQALPTVIGQSDDPVTWKVTAGSASISGGKVTFNSAGTAILQFHDRSDLGGSGWVDVTSAADCAKYGGVWANDATGEPDCEVYADFAGIVTYTVASAPATSYTVTFNPTGGTVSPTSKVVKIGDALGTLPTPTRAGFTFDGWYSQASGGVKYTSATVLTTKTDVTIYAHWTGKKYTITFNPNGGSTPKTGSKVTKTKTVTMGQAYQSLPTTARKNYNLLGWFTAKSGGTAVTSTTIVTTAGNATLYAHWALKTFTVKLNPRSGTVSPTSITVTYGKKYAGLPTPTRPGYMFKGWFTKTSGGTKVTSKTTVTLTKGQTLYAQWSAKKYKITFNPNGGSTPKTGSTVTKSKTVTFGKTFGTLPTTKLSGLKFAGWWTDPVAGTIVTAKSKVIFTVNTILYAHWA